MNSHVNDTQFFMGMAGENFWQISFAIDGEVNLCRKYHMKQQSQAGQVREDYGITSFAQQLLLAAASGDSDVLSRQSIENSHVNSAHFMSIANVGRPLQSGPLLYLGH